LSLIYKLSYGPLATKGLYPYLDSLDIYSKLRKNYKKCLKTHLPFYKYLQGDKTLKSSFITLLLLLSITNIHASFQKIIYGTDDRREVINSSSIIKKMSSGVLVNVENSKLIKKKNSYQIEHENLMKYRICFDEPYAKQGLLGDCTGFLIDDDLILTAGHCLNSLKDCQKRSWVFNFDLKSSEKRMINRDDVYKCKRVIKKVENTSKNIDYAIIQLVRKTKNRHIFKVSKKKRILKGQKIGMLGHPVGLPMKFTGPSKVLNASNSNYFTSKIDAFGGNSGSPVFDLNSNEVIGILIGGAMDFDDTIHQCKKSVVCKENTSAALCQKGETIFRTSKIKLDQILLNNKGQENFGWSPLQQAILEKDFNLVKKLVEAGADLNQVGNYDKHDALLISLITDQFEISEYLIDKGAQLNHQELSTGESAIMKAINKEQFELAIKMAKKGSNLELKSNDGFNAHDLADFQGDYDLMETLKSLSK